MYTDHDTRTDATTVGRPPIRPLPYELYRDIHKAIRVELFDAVAAAGRVDPNDQAGRVELAADVRDLVDFLILHAEHEDGELDGPIAEVLPDAAASIAADHAALEDDMQRLLALAGRMFDGDDADPRATTHILYLELAAFTSRYLAHQDVEERIVGPALFDHFGIEPLLEIHGRIMAGLTPDLMTWSLSKMLPAMNVDDRTEMFGGMRATAPPEVVDELLGLAADVLSAADYAALDQRLNAPAQAGVPS